MKKIIFAALFALALSGCAEFKAAGYDVFHEPWGTVKTAADAKCGVVSINQCMAADGMRSGGNGPGGR